MESFDSFILIGGRSSRLGRHKAFVELNGKTLLQRTVDIVRNGLETSSVTAVAANAAQFAIEAVVAEVPFIFDLHEGRGPLGGLHAALAYAKAPWIFVLACDYPFVSPQLIARLKEKISDEFGCIVPEQNDGRLQPLCAFYKVEAARPLVDEVIARPRVPPPMHEVVGLMNPHIVRFEAYSDLSGADELFININTPEDLSSARS